VTPVDVANISLLEIGNRVSINSFSDATPAAQACRVLYTSKIQALLRAANWSFARAQLSLTQWKAAIVNGAISPTPPPQPWYYSYLYPPDCLKMRFIQPTVVTAAAGTPLTTGGSGTWVYPQVPTAIPFVEGTDFDINNNPIRVLLTNVFQAQAIYTRDLSQTPDLWDSLFMTAATALLASFLIAALANDKAQLQIQVSLAKNSIDQARAINANEAIPNIDHFPDWLSARTGTGYGWSSLGSFAQPPGGQPYLSQDWDSIGLPDGQFF
jgi:hypothetical protein